MLKENKLGGINELDKPALERAKKADLVTLPNDVEGTNCYNCKWISKYKEEYKRMCTHPYVRQYVNERMCCAFWDNSGCYRAFGKMDKKYEVDKRYEVKE